MTRGIARLGDSTYGRCSVHNKDVAGIIISASPDSNCNGRGVARLGDNTAGEYISTIISASPDTTCN